MHPLLTDTVNVQAWVRSRYPALILPGPRDRGGRTIRGQVQVIHGDGVTPLLFFDPDLAWDALDAGIAAITRRPMVSQLLRMTTGTNTGGLLERIGRFIRDHLVTTRYNHTVPVDEEILAEDDASAMVAVWPGLWAVRDPCAIRPCSGDT